MPERTMVLQGIANQLRKENQTMPRWLPLFFVLTAVGCAVLYANFKVYQTATEHRIAYLERKLEVLDRRSQIIRDEQLKRTPMVYEKR